MLGNLVKDLPIKEARARLEIGCRKIGKLSWTGSLLKECHTYIILYVYIYICNYVIVYVYIILRMPCICIYTLCVSPFQQQWKVRAFFGIPLVNKWQMGKICNSFGGQIQVMTLTPPQIPKMDILKRSHLFQGPSFWGPETAISFRRCKNGLASFQLPAEAPSLHGQNVARSRFKYQLFTILPTQISWHFFAGTHSFSKNIPNIPCIASSRPKNGSYLILTTPVFKPIWPNYKNSPTWISLK